MERISQFKCEVMKAGTVAMKLGVSSDELEEALEEMIEDGDFEKLELPMGEEMEEGHE